jgi:integrase
MRKSRNGFRTKSEAEQFLRSAIADVKKIRAGEVAPDRPATLDALLDAFLDRHGRTVDPATARKLRQELKKARATFGDRDPATLRKAEIEDWRLDLPAGSRHDVFRALRQALLWAADPDRGLLERNPSDGIKNPKRKRHERREVFPFESWDEIEAIATELRDGSSGSVYAALVVLMAGTGLRPEEAFALHRADAEYATGAFTPGDGRVRGRLRVRRRFTRSELKEGTKTGGERLVPFGERVERVLRSLPPRIDTLILFPAPRGGYIDADAFRNRAWVPALRGAGLDRRRVYDLRHTYASWQLAVDVPPAKLAKMMGTSITQLEDTYHRFLRSDEQWGAAIDSFGGQVVGE